MPLYFTHWAFYSIFYTFLSYTYSYTELISGSMTFFYIHTVQFTVKSILSNQTKSLWNMQWRLILSFFEASVQWIQLIIIVMYLVWNMCTHSHERTHTNCRHWTSCSHLVWVSWNAALHTKHTHSRLTRSLSVCLMHSLILYKCLLTAHTQIKHSYKTPLIFTNSH